jgi:hypothetical protein
MKAYADWRYSSIERPGRFTFGERTLGTHWIRGWVGQIYLTKFSQIYNPGTDLQQRTNVLIYRSILCETALKLTLRVKHF